jgi:hypothetical protein
MGVEWLVVGAGGLVAVEVMRALALFAHELRKNCKIIFHNEFLRVSVSVSLLSHQTIAVTGKCCNCTVFLLRN